MQRFYEPSVESDFIKSLLYYVPTPIFEAVEIGDYVIEKNSYLYAGMIIKCTGTGYLDLDKLNKDKINSVSQGSITVQKYVPFYANGFYVSPVDGVYENGQITPYDSNEKVNAISAKQAEYDILTYYTFGDYDQKATPIFNNSASYYDSKTHKALGNYLRAYRASTGIDLMPYYNCYGAETVSNVIMSPKSGIRVTTSPVVISEYSKNIVYSIPICFNKTYLIHLDSMSGITVKAVIYDEEGGFVTDKATQELVSIVESNGKSNPIHFGGKRFSDPYTYSVYLQDQVSENQQFVYGNRNNLRLFIQVPRGKESTLIVTETRGKYTPMYTNLDENIFVNAEKDYGGFIGAPSNVQNRIMFSQTYLTKINTGKQYPFSDTLIQYLLLNVIDKEDKISDNIERVQKAIFNAPNPREFGQWSDNLRATLFNKYMKSGFNKYDINGYVDRRIENYLLRKTDYKGY